ncbi:MAG: hypothetical protein WD512_20540 [Candidatus Paceibacterota bacterium]
MSKKEIYNVTSNDQKSGVTTGKIINKTENIRESEKGINWKKVSAITGVLMLIIATITLIIKFYSNGE